MKVLIIGGGAREHALAWKIKRDRPEVELLLAPGNSGSGRLGRCLPVSSEDLTGLLKLAKREAVDLTVVGPEGPLAAGIADAFAAAGLRLFGPSAAAAQIEASKAWAKDFARRHGIPTARYATCASLDEAEVALAAFEAPPVVKEDGLAGGKGVTVPASFEEARAAAAALFAGRPNARVVIEERLDGWELSALALCDGRHGSLMPLACDYKRLNDADAGPNTGGMGAYAPAAVDAALRARIVEDILEPTLAGLAAEGRPFVGVLYPGLMMTSRGPYVLEFNCRWGDPEAEVLLPLLESDLLEVLQACLDGRLEQVPPRWSSQTCVGVVLASPGYPGTPATLEPALPAQLDGCAFQGGPSGRVLTVGALGSNLEEARRAAYEAVARVDLPGAHYRRDIAAFDRALTARSKA